MFSCYGTFLYWKSVAIVGIATSMPIKFPIPYSIFPKEIPGFKFGTPGNINRYSLVVLNRLH